MAGDTKFHCDHCPKVFSDRGLLRRHVEGVHEKLRPHQCEKCDYSASQMFDLKRHVTAVHEMLRSFQCEECPYSAAQKFTLQRHVKAVHEEDQKYKCEDNVTFRAYPHGTFKVRFSLACCEAVVV